MVSSNSEGEFRKLDNSVTKLVEGVRLLREGLRALMSQNPNVDYASLSALVKNVDQATDYCRIHLDAYKAAREAK